MRRTIQDRFWEKVDKTGDCWLWTGATNYFYGVFWLNGKMHLAHRIAWLLTHPGAQLQKDQYVCHTCDTPRCVRPDHLWLGNAVSNQRDAWKKGRH